MTEAEVIARTTGGPVTQSQLESDVRRLGVAPGETVLAHSSLSQLGWVVGGGQAVLLALEAVLGDGGTLVMPAFSDGAPVPSRWTSPPVPESWWPVIVREQPAWEPGLVSIRQMGIVAELFRNQPGTLQSFHPNKSFTARGPHAARLVADHALDYGFGERSPLARLYELDAKVLLLGVGHANNTSIHLAEYRAEWAGRRHPLRLTGRVRRAGTIEGVSFVDVDGTSDDFEQIGADYQRQGGAVTLGTVGQGSARYFRMRPLVDYAVGWIERNRRGEPGQPAVGSKLRQR